MNDSSSGIVGMIFLVVWLGVIVLTIAGCWKTFVKAGQPGWGCIIPILNIYFMCKIAGRPGWWVILFFIPIVNFVVAIMLTHDISRSFGRGIGTTLGLIFLPFVMWPVLGFGDAQYQGPAAAA